MLTIAETSAATGRSPDLVRRWIREGRLPAGKAPGGQWLVPLDAIDALSAFPRRRRARPSMSTDQERD